MEKAYKIAVGLIYGVGVIIVFILVLLILFQVRTVLNPDAMLPTELRELASIWLAMGCGPMLIASILFSNAYRISESTYKKRNTILIYIPGIICSINLVLWVGVLAIGMINMFINFY